MASRTLLFVFTLGAAAFAAGCRDCSDAPPVALESDPASCQPDAYLVELPAAGAYRLNGETRDSAGVARWLDGVLPRRTGTGRVVNIELEAPARGPDLRRLVPAMRRAGGHPYAADSTCEIEIPTRTPS